MARQAFAPDAFQSDAFQVQTSEFGYSMRFIYEDQTQFITAVPLTKNLPRQAFDPNAFQNDGFQIQETLIVDYGPAFAKDLTKRAVAVIDAGS